MGVVGVLGANGFIGAAVVDELVRAGHEMKPLPPVRPPVRTGWTAETAGDWLQSKPPGYDVLLDALASCDAIVNAAGLADAGSKDRTALETANVAVPLALLAAASRAGCPRLVQVSSAAVQGRRDPLDESRTHAPFSPYSRAKALAEHELLSSESGVEVAAYRAVSVQGRTRRATKRLVRYAQAPAVPVLQHGERPVPVALLANTAAAIAFLAGTPSRLSGVYLHPSEHMTVARLLRSLSPTVRLIPVPRSAVRAALATARQILRNSAGASARLRNLELVTLGQDQRSAKLAELGFENPVGADGYVALAERAREPE